jgi:hypothetical protein
MAAHLHLVDAGSPPVDFRDAVLDPGAEHEIGDTYLPGACGLAAGSPRWSAREPPLLGCPSRKGSSARKFHAIARGRLGGTQMALGR